MKELPRDVQAALTRALAAYLRATPAAQLPPSLRPVGRFGPKALAPHRGTLWRALEDEGLRALVVEWLDAGRAPVAKPDAEILRLASERPPGWAEELRGRSALPGKKEPSGGSGGEVAAARQRAQRARDDARRTREAARKSVADERLRAQEAERAAHDLRAEIEEARRALSERETEIAALGAARETERRTARRELERARRASDDARTKLKEKRTEAIRLTRELRRAEDRAAAAARRPPRAVERATRSRSRSALGVPLGRPGDDAETLDDWLKAPGVHLLVDGYNVTKAEGGFGDLDLRLQRERLREKIEALARRKGFGATLVFDGARQPPGKARRTRSSITVEYSRPDEEADDHLVARLEALPPDPVVVVTNDRELQERARAHGATIASSVQLLALIRATGSRG